MNCINEFTTNFIIELNNKINLTCEEQNIIIKTLENYIDKYEINKKELIVLDSDIKEKLILYLQSKKLEGLSEGTLKNYFYLLRKLVDFTYKRVNEITLTDLRAFILKESEGLKQTSVNTKIMCIQSFFKWLHEEEYIDKDPSKKLPVIKTPKRLRNSLTLEEVEKLRLACENYRDRAIIEILIATGCRLSEIVGMNIDSLNLIENSIKVIGKGTKERVVFFNDKTKVHINNYLNSRKDDEPALFIATKKPFNRLGQRSIEKDINRIAKKANIDKSVYPHLFRHTFATHALANGASMATIQTILGHSSVATTEKYAAVSIDNVKIEYKQHMIQ